MLMRFGRITAVPVLLGVVAPLVYATRAVSATGAAIPVISTLTPPAAPPGSSGVQVAINGSQFAVNAQARWNGSNRTTTFVSPTRLMVAILTSDLAAPRVAQVTVLNPGSDGGVSNGLGFVVGNPIPIIASLAPTAAPLTGEPFELTVNGDRFVSGAVVRINGAARATSFVSLTRLRATILASDLAQAGVAAISVFNPPPVGGVSGADSLTIALATPLMTGISPYARQFGGPAFTLRVNGLNFIRSASVRWNHADRQTTWVSPTQLDAAIPATDIAALGHADVSVFVHAPSGSNGGFRESASRQFDIASPATVISLSATVPMVVVRYEAVPVTFRGSTFMPQMVVRVNGAPHAATITSASEVRVNLEAADVQGSSMVFRFENPAPTLGVETATFYLYNPLPVASSLSPQSVLVGSQGLTLTVNGSKFVPQSVVRINRSARTTTFVSSTELRATLLASDLTQGGELPISVFTPSPAGGVSGALALARLVRGVRP